MLLDDPDNGPCREEHRRCRAVVKKVEAGDRLLSGGDVSGAAGEWRAATLLEPNNPAFLGPLLLKVGPGRVESRVELTHRIWSVVVRSGQARSGRVFA